MSASLSDIYRPSLALLTDLYQLTMAYGYWRSGCESDEAVFHLFFRRLPFAGGYAICAGLAHVVDLIEGFRFDDDDVGYLASLTGNDGQRLFEPGFLEYLAGMELSVDVDAIPEGTAVFPHAPLLRVRGPLIQCQLLETALLNIVNFQSLVATKASRVCSAAAGEPVLEFGLRRAQGIDGALAASRAAYIGGCAATSNVLAGRLYGIPVKGTHAHSWVMSFDSEMAAFEAYAAAMPNNCVFLVDTYDTLDGVRHAIAAGQRLREGGHEMVGIRLDSGDLAYLSIEARKLLDEAGFPGASIVASNDLDEHLITSLKQQGAQISVWGVGTKLATAYDQPALGGVYKLAAIRRGDGPWEYKVKLSEQTVKSSIPGILQVRRFRSSEGFAADMIYNEDAGEPQSMRVVDPVDPERSKLLDAAWESEDLLVPVIRDGNLISELPSLAALRERVATQLTQLHAGIKRFSNPHAYPCGLDAVLHGLRLKVIRRLRSGD